MRRARRSLRPKRITRAQLVSIVAAVLVPVLFLAYRGHTSYFLARYVGIGLTSEEPRPPPASCDALSDEALDEASHRYFPRDIRALMDVETDGGGLGPADQLGTLAAGSKERYAVVYLLLADERGRAYASEAALSLRSLRKRYFGVEALGRPRPAVIVFHGGLGQEERRALRDALGGAAPLHLVNIVRAVAAAPVRAAGWVRCGGHVYGAAYLAMNVWRVFQQWEALAALGVDRALSVDADLYARGPLRADPLAEAEAAGADYGYWRVTADPPDCVPLSAAARYFGCRAPAAPFQAAADVFQGNFQVVRVAAFRSAAYRRFAAFLASLGGMQTRRWSDQAIFTLFLKGAGAPVAASGAGAALCHKFCGRRDGDEGFYDPAPD